MSDEDTYFDDSAFSEDGTGGTIDDGALTLALLEGTGLAIALATVESWYLSDARYYTLQSSDFSHSTGQDACQHADTRMSLPRP